MFVDSAKLARVLEDRGQMQRWLASRVGVHETYISLILQNKRNPSADIRRRIAEVMGMAEDDLFVVHDDRAGTDEDNEDQPNGDAA